MYLAEYLDRFPDDVMTLMNRDLVELNEKIEQLLCCTIGIRPSTTHTLCIASRMNQRFPNSFLFPLVCMTVACLLSARTSVAQDIDTQYKALKALYAATDGDNWTNNSGWDTTLANPTAAELGGFFGVDVTSSQLVTRIRMRNNNLRGAIPAELGNLSNLSWLGLADNALSGPIPPELGNLSNVYYLSLSNNVLSGTIPPELRPTCAAEGPPTKWE